MLKFLLLHPHREKMIEDGKCACARHRNVDSVGEELEGFPRDINPELYVVEVEGSTWSKKKEQDHY